MKEVGIFKLSVIVLLFAGSFVSCSKKKNVEEPENIIGKWKLEKEVYTGWSTIIKTYYQYNIVCEFHPNGVLTVTADIDLFRYGLFIPGEYLFSSEDETNCYLEADEWQYSCQVSFNSMEIKLLNFTDPTYYFLKKIK